MLPIEMIRIAMDGTDEPRMSALKIWTRHLGHIEPSRFETDDDGDTFVHGLIQDCWVEISRIDDDVYVTAVASEKNLELHTFETFKDEKAICEVMSNLTTEIAKEISAGQVEIVMQFSCRKESGIEALNLFKETLPSVPVLPSAVEIQYRTVASGVFDGDPSLNFSRQAEWRTGQRIVRDSEGNESEIVDAFGSNQGMRSEPSGALTPDQLNFLIREMMYKLQQAADGGIDAL